MPVRRSTGGGISGYGVTGTFGDFTEQRTINFDIRSLSTEIPLPTTDPNNEDRDFAHWVVHLQWKFTVADIIADMERVKQYHVPTGAAQYGRYKVSAYDYVSNADFVTYRRMLSPLYMCGIIYDSSLPNEDVPCSEPQSGGQITLLSDAGYVPYTLNGLASGTSAFVSLNEVTAVPGDYLEVYFEPAVQFANVGITYIYRVSGYTQSEWSGEVFPPLVIF